MGSSTDLPEGSTHNLPSQTSNVTIFPKLVAKLADQFTDGKIPKWLNALITHNMSDATDEYVAPMLGKVIETMQSVLDDYTEGESRKLAHELEQGEAEAALTAVPDITE